MEEVQLVVCKCAWCEKEFETETNSTLLKEGVCQECYDTIPF